MLTFLYVLQMILSIALIAVVMFHKSEGGTGLISSNQYNSFFSGGSSSFNPFSKIVVILGFMIFANSMIIGAILIKSSSENESIIEQIQEYERQNKGNAEDIEDIDIVDTIPLGE